MGEGQALQLGDLAQRAGESRHHGLVAVAVGKGTFPFGEKALKKFAQTGMKEAVSLEVVLANLECEHKVAVLHYAPIPETLVGEPPEIFAFLGSEHLGIALDRQGVDLAVHGHAHHGSPEGKTAAGVPVHNVSRYVQEQHYGQCYRVFEIGKNGDKT